jgi:hypothetical protein
MYWFGNSHSIVARQLLRLRAKLLAGIHGVQDAFDPNRAAALLTLKRLRIG